MPVLFGLGYLVNQAAVGIARFCGADHNSQVAVSIFTGSFTAPLDPLGTAAAMGKSVLHAKACEDGQGSTAAMFDQAANVATTLVSIHSLGHAAGAVAPDVQPPPSGG